MNQSDCIMQRLVVLGSVDVTDLINNNTLSSTALRLMNSAVNLYIVMLLCTIYINGSTA